MPNPVNLATLGDTLPFMLQVPPAPGYGAIDVRRFLSADAVQEGVVSGGDFMVTQRAAGAGAGVDVAAGQALVQGDTVAREGLYSVGASAAFTGATQLDIAAPDVTNPRIDQVVLEVKNDTHDGSGLNLARLRVVAGTPTGGATLANRTGAAALPSTALRLADVLVPASGGAAAVTNAQIRDRRTWARGVNYMVSRSAGADYTTTSGSFVDIDATNLKPRLECSGAPVLITFTATIANSSTVITYLSPGVDSAAITQQAYVPPGAGTLEEQTYVVPYTPSAGSHQFSPMYAASAGTATVKITGGYILHFHVREIVAPNQANNTTTTG